MRDRRWNGKKRENNRKSRKEIKKKKRRIERLNRDRRKKEKKERGVDWSRKGEKYSFKEWECKRESKINTTKNK